MFGEGTVAFFGDKLFLDFGICYIVWKDGHDMPNIASDNFFS